MSCFEKKCSNLGFAKKIFTKNVLTAHLQKLIFAKYTFLISRNKTKSLKRATFKCSGIQGQTCRCSENCFSQSFGRLWLDKLIVRLRQGCFSSKVTFKIFCQQLHQTFRINLFQGTYVCLIMNVSFQDSQVIITGLINQSVLNQHVFEHNACSVSCPVFSMSVIYKSRKMILMLMIFGANNLGIKAFSKSSVWHMIKSSHHTCLSGHLLRKFKRQVT